jgi:ABC-type Mn2+/Zn2+ transport system permease subunit
MIADFVASWPLFHYTYLSGWLIALLLALIGVPVVARDQIFIGAAVSQAAMLGIAAGMVIGAMDAIAGYPWARSDAFLSAIGSMAAVLGALVTTRGGGRGESAEAVTGWVFLFCGSLSVILVAHSPHGSEEIHRLMASTIIGATEVDVLGFAVLTLLTAGALLRWQRPLRLLLMDRAMAAAVGVPVRLADRLLALWLGLAVGLAIRVSGVAYAFGCLVLPALIAKNLCREVRPMFVVAPVVAVSGGIVAFILANAYDYPPGQIAVALLSLLLAATWAARGRGKRSRLHL